MASVSTVVSLKFSGERAPAPKLVSTMSVVFTWPGVQRVVSGEGEEGPLPAAVGDTGRGEFGAGTDLRTGELLGPTKEGPVLDTSSGPLLMRFVTSECVEL